MYVHIFLLTRSLRELGGPCTKSMEVSESCMEQVKVSCACLQNVQSMVHTFYMYIHIPFDR